VTETMVAEDPTPPADPRTIEPPSALVVGVALAASAWAALVVARRLRRRMPLVEAGPRGPVPWTGGDVGIVFVIYLSAAMLSLGVLPEPASLGQKLLANLASFALALPAAIALLMARGARLGDLGFGVPTVGDLRLALGGLALVLAPLLGLAGLLDRVEPYAHPVIEYLQQNRDPLAVALVLVSAVLVAPVTEEFFFRRVLQGWLEKVLPRWDAAGALVMSAGLFALAHVGQGLAWVPLFFLGLLLGFLARRTGSIMACILLHALFNAVSVALVLW
jgi:membrane protease YdiL (CAAX protease family)